MSKSAAIDPGSRAATQTRRDDIAQPHASLYKFPGDD
jgi:hypothetical protein